MSADPNNPTGQAPESKKTILQRQETVKDNILAFIQTAEADGKLQFPKNYSAINALNSAWLYLKEAQDSDKRPVLEVCSPASVAQSLMKMLTNGLSVIKDQCYFIAYAGKLDCSISYHGKELMAKRSGGVVRVFANAIYEKDEFTFEVDNETGIKKITSHTQDLTTIGDGTKIKGAYAIVVFEDGRRELTIMTKDQILMAWNQRKGNGLTPAHQKFTDEMACKTVRNRGLKHATSTSDDASLFDDDDDKKDEKNPDNQIKSKANIESLDFDEHTDVTALPVPVENPITDLLEKKSMQAEPVQAAKQAVNGTATARPDF